MVCGGGFEWGDSYYDKTIHNRVHEDEAQILPFALQCLLLQVFHKCGDAQISVREAATFEVTGCWLVYHL